MDTVTLEIVKAVGPVFGGGLSAAVGWLASSFLHSSGVKQRKREFYLSKLEELSRATHNLQGGMGKFVSHMTLLMHNRVILRQESVEELGKCLCEIIPVYQLQSFYFPSMEAHTRAVEGVGNKIGGLVYAYREQLDPSEASKQMHKLAFEFARACADLRSATAQEAAKYTP